MINESSNSLSVVISCDSNVGVCGAAEPDVESDNLNLFNDQILLSDSTLNQELTLCDIEEFEKDFLMNPDEIHEPDDEESVCGNRVESSSSRCWDEITFELDNAGAVRQPSEEDGRCLKRLQRGANVKSSNKKSRSGPELAAAPKSTNVSTKQSSKSSTAKKRRLRPAFF